MRIVAFAMLALAESTAPAQSVGVVEVHLSNFKFTPATVMFAAGRSYRLRIVNDGTGGHNFAAKTFFAAADVAAQDRRLIKDGEVEVPGGQAREIRLIAPAPGKYSLKCTHFMHPAFGMKGDIVVR